MYRKMKRAMALCLCLTAIAVLAAACDEDGAFQTPANILGPTVAPLPTAESLPTAASLPTVAPLPTVVSLPTVADLPTWTPVATATIDPTATPTAGPPAGFAPPDPADGVGDVQEALIGGQVFRLEVARTAEERARGLMNRPSLTRDSAMLFVFPEEDYRGFWMKNTLIPLDILFLDSRGVVVDVQTMTPQPGVRDSELTVYRSAAPARYAIEINAGMAREHGVEPGAQVLFR